VRTVYRVTVAAVKYDDEGNFVADDTLFEATHHRPEALLRFAPGEVEVVLEEVALTGTPPQQVMQGLPAMPVPVADWDRAAAPAPVDGAATVQQAEAPTAPKTRKRRTKAEIAADEAAAQLAAQQAGSATPAPDGPAPQAPEPEPLAAQPAAPVAVPEPVPAKAGATPASTPLTPGVPPAPSGDGAPWNPFMQR